MNKETFIRILAEENIPEKDHEGLWQTAERLGYVTDGDYSGTEENLREVTRQFAPILNLLRQHHKTELDQI